MKRIEKNKSAVNQWENGNNIAQKIRIKGIEL